MRIYFIVFFYAISIVAKGQNGYTKELAFYESFFALKSQIVGLKEGFLSNLDSNAKGLNKNGFTNLYRAWSNRPTLGAGPSLIWEPLFIYAGDKGLTGVSYGPHFTKQQGDTVFTQSGYFFTVWHRENTSEPYKIIFDSGVKASDKKNSSENNKASLKSFSTKENIGTNKAEDVKNFLVNFQKEAAVSLEKAVEKYMIPEGNIVVSNEGIIAKPAVKNLDIAKQKFSMTTESINITNSSLFIEFGSMTPENSNQKAHYVHLWNRAEKELKLISALYKFE